MNFRKSLKSMHHQGSQSMKKIQLNALDLQQCTNQYTDSAQSTKQSENSILNKLLLQPPSMKAHQKSTTNKLSLQSSTKKYQPKFAKPDVQNLIQENINLKNIIQTSNQAINQLKIKNCQLDRKIRLLQRGLEKVENGRDEGNGVSRHESKYDTDSSNKENSYAVKGGIVENKKDGATVGPGGQRAQPFSKTGMVHTQILKKKIADLTANNVAAQNELKFLKKLPNITIYEQNDVQKQHLIAETIRLKSIITSLSQENAPFHSQQSEKFQNQFMRLMKEENEKLKATIRLLQNDKILLKSRQTIQNKLNSDLKKDIEHLKSKLLYKESELEKINNENKNLLFKKTTQFRQEQEKKENEVILELKARLVDAETEKVKLEQNNDFYCEENMTLKEKEKNLTQEIVEIQSKYDKLVKKLNQEIEQLQFQLNNLKNDYINLLNSGSLKKKKSLGLSKMPSNMLATHTNSTFYSTSNQANQNITIQAVQSQLHRSNSQSLQQKIHYLSSNFNANLYFRSVKWEDIGLGMANLLVTLEENPFLTVDSLVKNVEEHGQVRCGDVLMMFTDEPFNMTKEQAMKLSRYICQDSKMQTNGKILYNDNTSIQSSLARTILTSSLQKTSCKLSPSFLQSWQKILQKTKKLPSIIQTFIQGKSHLKKDELVEVIDKYSRQKVGIEEYDFLGLRCMEKGLSEEEFVLSGAKVKEWLGEVIGWEAEKE